MNDRITLDTLLGMTLREVKGEKGGDTLTFDTESGARFQLYHESNCCESVRIEDITGDLSDLVGAPLLLVVESTSAEDPSDYLSQSSHDESFTWTFYRFGTIKGTVVVRWLGESNGYYSESVDFREL